MEVTNEISNLSIIDLRPCIQQELGIDTWPVDDWIVVGKVLDLITIRMDRAPWPPYPYTVVIMSKQVGGGIGTSSDACPVTAVFRAYLTWLAYQRSGNT